MEINSKNKFSLLSVSELETLTELITGNEFLVSFDTDLMIEFYRCIMEDLKAMEIHDQPVSLYNKLDFDLAINTYVYTDRNVTVSSSDVYTVLAFVKDFYDNLFRSEIFLTLDIRNIRVSTEFPDEYDEDQMLFEMENRI